MFSAWNVQDREEILLFTTRGFQAFTKQTQSTVIPCVVSLIKFTTKTHTDAEERETRMSV